jgi:hypothetical protein
MKDLVWFNKVIKGFEGRIDVTIHDVPDGDHTDLYVQASVEKSIMMADVSPPQARQIGGDLRCVRDDQV